MKHAFLDVEAFRLKKPWMAPLVNVAAVTFDEYANVHSSIDLYVEPSQFPVWSQPEASTLTWWQQQDKWKDLMNRVHMLGDFPSEVLKKLKGFLDSEGVEAFWFAGPQYDQIMLEAYFDGFDMEHPWKYNQARDFRTIRKQHMDLLESFPKNPNAHLALEDCLYDISRLRHITEQRGITWK
jgi:hypothetical protein